jgi:hypothetical protein
MEWLEFSFGILFIIGLFVLSIGLWTLMEKIDKYKIDD